MATLVRRLSVPSTTAAAITGSFREFVSFVRDSFEMAGFVNQYPSNMINTTSVAPSNLTFRDVGSDIFAFNDAFQGTHPLFVKVDYTSAQIVNTFGLRFTIGDLYISSSDYIGVDSSVLPPTSSTNIWARTTTTGNPNVAQTQSCMSSGRDGNQLFVSLYPQASGTNAIQHQLMFMIERTRDWHGNIVPSGAVVITRDRNMGQLYYHNEFYKSYVVRNTTRGFVGTMSLTTSSIRPVIQPIVVGKNMSEPPPLGLIFTHASESATALGNAVDVSASINQTAIQFGSVTYNYIRLPTTPLASANMVFNSAAPQFMAIWE